MELDDRGPRVKPQRIVSPRQHRHRASHANDRSSSSLGLPRRHSRQESSLDVLRLGLCTLAFKSAPRQAMERQVGRLILIRCRVTIWSVAKPHLRGRPLVVRLDCRVGVIECQCRWRVGSNPLQASDPPAQGSALLEHSRGRSDTVPLILGAVSLWAFSLLFERRAGWVISEMVPCRVSAT